MSQSQERRLSVGERWNVWLHLLVCTWCVRYLRQIKLLRRIALSQTTSYPAYSVIPASLSAEGRARITDSLRRN